MRRLIFLIVLGVSTFIGALIGPREIYNGLYFDKDGQLLLIINNDKTGLCTKDNVPGLPRGSFHWRLLTEDANKLLITYENSEERTLWLGSEAIEGGHAYLDGKDSILYIIDDQENIVGQAGYKQIEPETEVNRAQISTE